MSCSDVVMSGSDVGVNMGKEKSSGVNMGKEKSSGGE